jgi:hypothetical protein
MGLTRQVTDLMEVCAPWDNPLLDAVECPGGNVCRLGLHNGFALIIPVLRKLLRNSLTNNQSICMSLHLVTLGQQETTVHPTIMIRSLLVKN